MLSDERSSMQGLTLQWQTARFYSRVTEVFCSAQAAWCPTAREKKLGGKKRGESNENRQKEKKKKKKKIELGFGCGKCFLFIPKFLFRQTLPTCFCCIQKVSSNSCQLSWCSKEQAGHLLQEYSHFLLYQIKSSIFFTSPQSALLQHHLPVKTQIASECELFLVPI